ncbi:hypothetical protein FACS1894201_08680 [Bacteroidia bacterium]|nr:hypothetical protein FACS1894201_08680 [Bacteroidia bacterium]
MTKFSLKFSGLANGVHVFHFETTTDWFRAYRYEEIDQCRVNIDVRLNKSERMMVLDFVFAGSITVSCDRCLDSLEIPVQHTEQVIVNFGQTTQFDEDAWMVSEKEFQIDLSDFIYETIVLQRPVSAMHALEDCNPEMINRLQQINMEPTSLTVDPRWNKLLE